MRIDVITLFPEMFEGPLRESIIGRARERGLLILGLHDLREYATDRHHVVDDAPYGGGAGMVLKVEPIAAALRDVKREGARVILLSPQGRVFTQEVARELAVSTSGFVLVCGRYEGFDERVRSLVDDEISIGDYVLTGGELAAMVVIDAVCRLVPGVIEAASLEHESHTSGLLEYPQYTRPPEFGGMRVPDVLLSGDHKAIAQWRESEARKRTRDRRPDLEGARPDAAELAGDYASGVGSYRLARKYGLSPATVRARLRAAGVALRPARQAARGPSAEDVARLHASGIGVREMARRFGVSHVTILNRLKRTQKS
ncbi:MAG: tRNA (guanosine(37)-N1)-methyltransferase TrmD [Chloroflexi bacterium]|nr:MAG: tRNA (guanosine(37)-N1)-methyltransferase TrmD [Chloroflexota bacterium]